MSHGKISLQNVSFIFHCEQVSPSRRLSRPFHHFKRGEEDNDDVGFHHHRFLHMPVSIHHHAHHLCFLQVLFHKHSPSVSHRSLSGRTVIRLQMYF